MNRHGNHRPAAGKTTAPQPVGSRWQRWGLWLASAFVTAGGTAALMGIVQGLATGRLPVLARSSRRVMVWAVEPGWFIATLASYLVVAALLFGTVWLLWWLARHDEPQ